MGSISFPILLLSGGLTVGLLAAAAGDALGDGADGERRSPPRDGRGCTSFLVGASGPGEILLHLANDGGVTISARLELVDEVGDRRTVGTYGLGPHATQAVILQRPPPEIGLKISAGSPDLRVYAEHVPDDGSEPEPYLPGGCA